MPLIASGKFVRRIVILTVNRQAQGENGEEIGRWPSPPVGTATYSAAIESFGANEVIAQGQNHATGSRRLRIRGRNIAVTTEDRVKDKVTGEVFHVTSVARDEYDTIIDVSRVIGQEVAQ